MSNRILVTGATGTIGTALTRELRGAGVPFEAISSRADTTIDGAQIRHADLRDPASLQRAFGGIDTLFLLLPLVPEKLALARNAVGAARAAGVRHIVRASGIGADPDSPYALMRLQGEIDALIAGSGLACTLLRPAGFMQNYLTYQLGQVRDGTLYLAHGDTPQPMIDARDIGAAAARILAAPQAHAGRTYALTGGEALSEHDVAATLSQVLDRDVRYAPVSCAQAAEAMRGVGMPPLLVELLDSLNRYVCDGQGTAVSPDLPALLGRTPTRFAQFAREHAAVWR